MFKPSDRTTDMPTAEEEHAIKWWTAWLYRHEIKQPPDSLEDLAREHENVTTQDVRDGIAEARRLLDDLCTPIEDE